MASMEGNETSDEAVDENTVFASVADFLRFLRTKRLSELPSAVTSTEKSARHSPAPPRSDQDDSSDSIGGSPHQSSSSEEPAWPPRKGTTEFNDYVIEEVIRRLEEIAEAQDKSRTMASPARPQLVFTDGSLADHVQDLADYMHIGEEVQPLLAKDQHEEALAKIVRASGYLSSVPEKEFTPAYNLLVYLVINESKEPKKYLPTICSNLQKPISSSPVNGAGLALSGLQTVFNLIDSKNSLRYNVFMEILKFVKAHNMYDNLKGGLKNLPRWLQTWDVDEEDQRKLYTEVADIALEAGEQEESYQYLLKALREFDASDDEEIKSEEAQKLSLRALRMALLSNTHYDFQDLRVLPTVQALSDSHPVYSQLLDLFAEQDLEDYNDFREEHEGWIEKEKLDHDKLQRKIRLLTFTSLAASTSSRQIEYKAIAKALQIPSEDVEMWAIDVIRAGLVEGKMSQQKQLFLVHRTTYRVFGEKQWRELGTRVDAWKHSLRDVLSAIRRSQNEAEAQKEREQQEMERRLQNANLGEGGQQGGSGGGQRRDRRQQQQQQQQRREDDD